MALIGLALSAAKGGMQGLANKEGASANLNFSTQAALKANKNSIVNGAKTGAVAKNGIIGFITRGVGSILLDPEGTFDKMPVGKAFNKEIDNGANA